MSKSQMKRIKAMTTDTEDRSRTHWQGCHTAHLDCAILRVVTLEAAIERLREALDTIQGGWTSRFPGGPEPENATPSGFQAAMWVWSQAVARAALNPPAAPLAAFDKISAGEKP